METKRKAREIHPERVQKIHQLVFSTAMTTLIIWPYLRHIHNIVAITLVLGNIVILIEYAALLAYLSPPTCEYPNAPAEDQPFQTSAYISDT